MVNTAIKLKVCRDFEDLIRSHDPALWLMDLDALFTAAYLHGLAEGERVQKHLLEVEESASIDARIAAGEDPFAA
jgi:hypothetical protein